MAGKKKAPAAPVVLTREQLIERARGIFHMFDSALPEAVPQPSRTFVPGEPCLIGNLSNCIIVDSYLDGKAYLVEHDVIIQRQDQHRYEGKEVPRQFVVEWWFAIEKANARSSQLPKLMDPWRRPNLTNGSLDSLVSFVRHNGLVCDPMYQRGYVWNDHDKDALLESLFERCEIGSFTFVRKAGFHHPDDKTLVKYLNLDGTEFTVQRCNDYNVTIVDGQQRLTTIIDFFFDKRPYKGIYFSQLHFHDQVELEHTSVAYRIIDEEDISPAQILKLFLQVNRGVPQSTEHLEKVQRLYEQELKKEKQ